MHFPAGRQKWHNQESRNVGSWDAGDDGDDDSDASDDDDIDHDDDFPIYRDGADAGDDDDDDDDGGALKSDGFCRKGKGEAW